ncbi:FCD domain-containing protein [Rhodococcus erythropolis]|nr:FCD domain-containing protein [Rhodococcus erythropolis]
MTDLAQQMSRGGPRSRTEQATSAIEQLVKRSPNGTRLGTKRELQEQCGVAKGTFNEALRILQARGVITVRSGPGGGLFAATPTPLARLGNSLLALDSDGADVADAVRIRDALDPLLIDDALENSSAADITRMRATLNAMQTAIDDDKPTEFVKANWDLHGVIAGISPNLILKSVYLSLLELIESHTVSVLPAAGESLSEYICERHQLHVDLVDALDVRDRARALDLIARHNTNAETSTMP